MEVSSVLDRNPWEEQNTPTCAVSQAIALAQRTGHIKWDINQTERRDILKGQEEKYSSLQLIEKLTELETKRKQLDEILLEIQCRSQSAETSDLVEPQALDEKITDVTEFNNHLQAIVHQKDQLISRLQKPYIGDHLRIEAPYKRDVAEVFPKIVPILSQLTTQLDNIDSLKQLKISDGKLESVLTDISSSLASLQTGFQNISSLRATTSQLHSQQT